MAKRCDTPLPIPTPDEELICVQETFSNVKNLNDPYQKKVTIARCIQCIKNIPKKTEFLSAFRLCLDLTNKIGGYPGDRYSILSVLSKELPKVKDFYSLYGAIIKERIRTARDIENPITRKDSLIAIAAEVSDNEILRPLYVEALEDAIKASKEIADPQHKIHALMGIINIIPDEEEFKDLKLKAYRLALNTAGATKDSIYNPALLRKIAHTLPKSCDVSFYRQYTLLGIAKEIPKAGEFLELYKDTISLAIAAATTIEEPVYRKYALCYIAQEVADVEPLAYLYKHTLREAFKAASMISDHLVRVHAIIDILKILPKTSEFFPEIEKALKDILEIYSIEKRIRELTPLDILDYVLLVDEKIIKDSKKQQFTKMKYAHILAKELERFAPLINDIRFIPLLKPYTHIWIKPKELRKAATKIVTHLETLKRKFHGREIERPTFIDEFFPAPIIRAGIRQDELVKDCMAIDLGATNTVIMRKRWGTQPEFITINGISREYNNIPVIPTAISKRTNLIGVPALNEIDLVSNFKNMILEGNEEGIEYLERYLIILFQHLKDELNTSRWFSFLSGPVREKVYITIPIGFQFYKDIMQRVIKRRIRDIDIEFLEEPLAAAIGYQIAEEQDKLVMIIDFGGSTMDVMVTRLNINEAHVIAKPDRSLRLGGKDIDLWVAEYIIQNILTGKGKISPDLLEVAETIKISLSDQEEVLIRWDNRDITINRADFEKILDRHGFYRSIDRAISQVLWKAQRVGIKREKIEAILLTGGSSLIPSFKDKIASLFPGLHEANAIYTHSPFTAVATGAALYPTRSISDKHLGLAYALKYKTGDEEKPTAYEIVFEKGESFPFEKTFRITPARTLGEQKEIYLELFEVPEKYITRRWERENGLEFIKQVLKSMDNMVLTPLRIITLTFKNPLNEDTYITFQVDERGHLSVRYGPEKKKIDTGIRLQ